MASVAIALIVLLPAGRAAAQTPTLADLAKKEEARRKALTAPARVYTKDDLPPSAVVGSATPAAPAAAEDTAAPGDPTADAPKENEKGEAWWRERMAQAREGLRRNQLFAEALQSRMNAMAVDVANRDDPAQRQLLGQEQQKAVQGFAQVQGDVAKLKKEIADIEEAARVAGVPPGWVR